MQDFDKLSQGASPEPSPDGASVKIFVSPERADWLSRFVLLFCVGLPLGQFLLLPPFGFWTADDGNKFLLGRGELSTLIQPSLPYLGQGIDPELRWVPIARPFAHPVENRLVSQYPPAFSMASRIVEAAAERLSKWDNRIGGGALTTRLRGEVGGLVGKAHLWLPLLGGLATILAIWTLSPRLSLSRPLSLLFAWAFSPLLFYATLHWEHTWVAALVTIALGLIVLAPESRRPSASVVAAGFCLALATSMREETVLIAVSAGVVIFCENRRTAVGLVAIYLLSLLPFFWWQHATTGSLWGLHLTGNVQAGFGLVTWLGTRGEVARSLLFSTLPLPPLLLPGMGLTLASLGVIPLWLSRHRRLSSRGSFYHSLDLFALLSGILLLAGGTLLILHRLPLPTALVRCSGLLLFAPWVMFCPLARGTEGIRRLRRMVGVSLLLLLLATPIVSASGIHWGPRILLSILPPMAWLAVSGITTAWKRAVGSSSRVRKALLGSTATVVFPMLLILQLQGLSVQRRGVEGTSDLLAQTRMGIAAHSQSLDDRVESEPSPRERPPIVTHLWWYAQVLAPLCEERPIYLVRTRTEFAAWFDQFYEDGGRSFYWATTTPDLQMLRGLPLQVETLARVRSEAQPGLGHSLLAVTSR